MEQENIYYVYALLDPSKDNQPFYIGKGKKNRVTDHFKHWNLASCTNKYKNNIIHRYRKLGFEDCFEIIESNLSNEYAKFLEIYLISYFGRSDKKEGFLTNGTDGGDDFEGVRHLPVSKETRLKQSIRQTGRKRPAHVSELLRKALTGIERPKEVMQIAKKNLRRVTKIIRATFPDGKIIETDNFKKFCLDNELSYDSARRHSSYKGICFETLGYKISYPNKKAEYVDKL